MKSQFGGTTADGFSAGQARRYGDDEGDGQSINRAVHHFGESPAAKTFVHTMHRSYYISAVRIEDLSIFIAAITAPRIWNT